MNPWSIFIQHQPKALFPNNEIIASMSELYRDNLSIPQVQFLIGKIHLNTKKWPITWKNTLFPYVLAYVISRIDSLDWKDVFQLWQHDVYEYVERSLIIVSDHDGPMKSLQWLLTLPQEQMNSLLYLADEWFYSIELTDDPEYWTFLKKSSPSLGLYKKVPLEIQFYFWQNCQWRGKVPILNYISEKQRQILYEESPLLLWEAIIHPDITWDVTNAYEAYSSIWKVTDILSLGTMPFRSMGGLKKAVEWLQTPEACAYLIRQVPAKKENAWLLFVEVLLQRNPTREYFQLRNQHNLSKSVELLLFDLENSTWPLLEEGILDEHNLLDRNKYLEVLRLGGHSNPNIIQENEAEIFFDFDGVGYSDSISMAP